MTCYVAWVPLGLDSDSTCLSNPFKKLWNSHWIHRPLDTFGCLSPARPGPRARDHVDKVPWSSSSFTHYSQAVVENIWKYKHIKHLIILSWTRNTGTTRSSADALRRWPAVCWTWSLPTLTIFCHLPPTPNMADLWREMSGVYPHHSASFRIQVSGQLADEIFIVRAKAGRIREELVKKIHEHTVTICNNL